MQKNRLNVPPEENQPRLRGFTPLPPLSELQNRQVCEQAGALLVVARSKGRTVPLGDGLHAAVAKIHGLEVLTTDVDHFLAMGVKARKPLLENPPAQPRP